MALKRWIYSAIAGILIVLCFSVALYYFVPKYTWHLRYGTTLKAHNRLIELYKHAKHIDEITVHYPLKRWHVSEASAITSQSEFWIILKFCRGGAQNRDEQIVVWCDVERTVVRWILVCKDGCRFCKNMSANIELNIKLEELEQMMKRLGYVKCCHAALLDIVSKKHGIKSYRVNSSLYYEIEISPDMWLYWETDSAGNILARGAHDSP